MEVFRVFGSFIINREEAIKSIDDVEKRADKATDKMKRGFDEIGRASEESSKRIAQGFDKAADASDKTSKSISDGFDRVAEKAESAGDRIDDQRGVLSELESAFLSVADVGSASMRDLETATDRLEKSTDDLGDQLKDTGDEAQRTGDKIADLKKSQDDASKSTEKASGIWADFNKKLQEFGGPVIGGVLNGLTKLGALLTNPIGAAISLIGTLGAIGTQGLKTAVQLDDLALQYRAATGANVEETERFREAVETLYRSNTDSYEAIAEAVTAVRQRLGDLGDDMAAVTQRYMDFASVNKTDVKSAVSMVIDTLDAFNLPLEMSVDLMDKLTRASQATGRPIDSIVATLQKSASAIQGLNLSLDDAIGLLTMFESVGIPAERVNNAFANSLQRLERPTESQAEALRRLGVTLDENNRVVDSYDVALKRMIKTIREADHEADVFEDARAIFGVNAGQQWVRGIRAAGDSIDEFMQLIQEAEGTVQRAADVMNESLGTRWEIIKRNYIEPFVEYLGEVFLVVLENIIAFIETWAPRVQELFSWVGDAISAVWATLVADTGESFGSIYESIQYYWQAVTELTQVVLEWIQKIWATHGETIMTIVRTVFEAVIQIFQSATKVITGIVDVFVGLFTGNWERMGHGIQKMWEGLWDAIIAALHLAITYVVTAWDTLWTTLQGLWNRFISNWNTEDFLNAIKQTFLRAINWMVTDLPRYLADVARRIMAAFRNALARNAAKIPVIGGEIASKIGTTTEEPTIDYDRMLREATSSTLGSTRQPAPSTSWLDVGPAPSISISAPKFEVELPDTDLSYPDWSGFGFDDFGFDFGGFGGFGGFNFISPSRRSGGTTTIQLDEKTSKTFFEKLEELINRIVDAIDDISTRFAFEVRDIVRNFEELLLQPVLPVSIEDIDPSVSDDDVAPGTGYKTANILLQLDGRIIARAIGQPLVDEIMIKGGI